MKRKLANSNLDRRERILVTSVKDFLGQQLLRNTVDRLLTWCAHTPTPRTTSGGNGGAYAYIYYAMLSSSGPDTATATFSSTPSDYNGFAYLFIYEIFGVTTTGVATGTGSGIISGVSGSISTSSTGFQSGAFLVAIMENDIFSSNWVAGSGFQLSPPPHSGGAVDQFITLSKAEYSTSGVSSPTDFPATLSSSNPSQDWVEVSIALNPLPVTTVSSSTTSTVIRSTSTVYSTLSTLSTVGTSTSTRVTTTTSTTMVGGTVTESVIVIDAVYAYLLLILRTVVAPVGGFIEPVNKVGVLLPWLMILGCLAAVVFVVVKPQKKREN
jgi:hypothetical protein